MKRAHVLHGFRHVKPKFQTPQAESADWLAHAHTVAEEVLAEGSTAFDRDRFFDRLSRVLSRLGAGRDPILARGHECSDFRHRDWSAMRLFNLRAGPRGAGFEERNRFFVEAATDVFEKLYPAETDIPDDLIHVTCTGYASPSPAQLLVSGRRVRKPVNVVHAYHMGCYAAFPAVALAVGLRSASELRSKSGDGPRKTDVVHTEMCSIHLDPSRHSMEQLVVQTLFADGFIKYSVGELGETHVFDGGGFEILAIREELIPESSTAMTWVPTDWGLHMTLTAEVPTLISASLAAFLDGLSRQIDADFADLKKRAMFAVHPGGPKILSAVQETLGLGDEQLRASREVLSECGNMSSATVPHVWERILNDPRIDSGTLVFSLAFGPGLTVCGNLLRKL